LAKSLELGPFALTLKTQAQEFKNEVVAYMASCLEPHVFSSIVLLGFGESKIHLKYYRFKFGPRSFA
jgi:hypothetical protein